MREAVLTSTQEYRYAKGRRIEKKESKCETRAKLNKQGFALELNDLDFNTYFVIILLDQELCGLIKHRDNKNSRASYSLTRDGMAILLIRSVRSN
jgi:hypothetical protein